jgi:glycosyltransferase involved in cell wall biosynthesis
MTHRQRTRSRTAAPTVTVVIPTHDREVLLRQSLSAALSQEGVPLEVVVVDDGSADGTQRMLASLSDPRVRVIRQEPARGVATARNRGIEEACADWIAFLDDDDLWAPDKLRSQLEAARRANRRWCYVGHVNIDPRNRVTGGGPPLQPHRIIEELRQSDVIPGGCSGVIATKEILHEAGLFDPGLQPLADWDLWIRLARIEPPAGVARPLVAYRVQNESMSMNAARVLSEFEILGRRYGQGNRASLFRYLGWWSLRGNRPLEALRFFVRAALERRREYRIRDLLIDASYVAGDRLGPGRPLGQVLVRRAAGGEEHRGWMAEGQAWVDALSGSLDDTGLG